MNLNCKNCPNNGINEFACETCMIEYSFNLQDENEEENTSETFEKITNVIKNYN